MATTVPLIQFDVDTFDVDELLRAVEASISAPALLAFLEGPAHRHLTDDIVQRFAFEGDKKSGDWPPLSETTVRIREAMGYTPDDINERSGELIAWLTTSQDVFWGEGWAMIGIPGQGDALDRRKLEVAQMGTVDNPLFPGAITPPRPVLAVDETDLIALLELLAVQIALVIETRMVP